MENSSFNWSGTPQKPRPVQDEKLEVISTPELQSWLGSIEQCLNEVCSIATDGKLNSEQKLRINNLCRKVVHGVAQMTLQYQSIRHKAVQNHISVQAMTEEQGLVDYLTEIKQSIDEVRAKTVPAVPTFANMVKKGNNFVRPNTLSAVAIYPNDSTKSSEDTKNLVQKIVSPVDMKLQVRGVRKTRNGGITISTETKKDMEKLKETVQLTASGLKVDEPFKRKPRITVIGVPTSMTDSEVFKCIYEQNLSEKIPSMTQKTFMTSIRLSHKSGKKDSETCNYVIEVTADIRKVLINQNRLFVNWTSCPVRDFTLVTRCYKCQLYGHAAKTCRSVFSVCGHCGEEGHSIQECKNKTAAPKCATCYRFKKPSNHKTGDAECPARKASEYRYIHSIDYDGAK